MAAGFTSAGFGGGALITSQLIKKFMDKFNKAPEYLGNNISDSLIINEGLKHI